MFQITRENGKSNTRVLLDYVCGSEPGRIFKYEELIKVLNENINKKYGVHEIQLIVSNAQSQLLKEQSRTLYNVRNVGYKVAHANEHNKLALTRKDRADTQLSRGVKILQNVRWEEMDAQSRLAHEGSLLIMSSLYSQQQGYEKRINAVETALKNIGALPSM